MEILMKMFVLDDRQSGSWQSLAESASRTCGRFSAAARGSRKTGLSVSSGSPVRVQGGASYR